MRDTPEPLKKLYFFSALYGEAMRILNWEWDREIALIYAVCQHTYQSIQTRLQTMVSGAERVAQLPPNVFDILTTATEDLANYVSVSENPDKQKLVDILGRLSEASYMATGNGYYLYERGRLEI